MRILGSSLLATGLSALLVAAPLPASAQDSVAYTSYAEAQFLAGKNALGELVNIIGDGVEEEGASLSFPEGGEQFTLSPLQALDQLTIPVGDTLLGSEIGPVGSYAAAGNGGSSRAASGAVTKDGIVHVGGEGQPADSFATLSLSNGSLEPLTELLLDLRLELGAISSSAEQASPTAAVERSYSIAGSQLVLDVPLLETINSSLGGAPSLSLPEEATVGLAEVCEILAGVLTAPLPGGGEINVCEQLEDLLGVKITGLNALTDGLESYTANGIAFDLAAGTITVDLATVLDRVLGLDINNLPENTDLLHTVLPALVQQLPGLVQAFYDDIVAQLLDQLGISLLIGGFEAPLPIESLTRDALRPLLDTIFEQLRPALEQIVEPLADGLGTLTEQLAQIAQILVNVPDEYTALSNADTSQGEVHSISALRVKLFDLGGGDGQLADLLLANSLVGPNQALDVTVPDDPGPNDPADRDENNVGGLLPRTGVGLLAPVLFAGLAILGTGYLLTRRGKGDEAGPLGLS
ncbi:hypothetical protein D9V41_02075 [Aeromicrobium phragmitis]|uniref:Choice-of-anchor G family protein n=1 Tax=Aeromicrobium phragmitis TaxID=2478914 RepID=A0A3L8PTU9_9ACTN|nr:choice-of-anchor G family protein [Aeromicrobium phragmitis]RLV57442.1 hypothetical protein D9V41_02075 [Aeromicrobium phragmitis]